MASVSTVLTLGFGSFGSTDLVITLGYGLGVEVEPAPPEAFQPATGAGWGSLLGGGGYGGYRQPSKKFLDDILEGEDRRQRAEAERQREEKQLASQRRKLQAQIEEDDRLLLEGIL
jgi:hypothetical protein